MKILKILFVLALLVILPLVAILVVNQSPAVQQFVLTLISNQFGASIQSNNLQISPLNGITLRGITIAHPAGINDALLTADEFVMSGNLWSLLRQRAQLTLTNADIIVRDQMQQEFVRIHNLNINTDVEGHGQARIKELISHHLLIHDITTPVKLSTTEVKFVTINGMFVDGLVSGNFVVQLADLFQYALNLTVKDGDMGKFLQEARLAPILTGKLQLATALTGQGKPATILGNGKIEITNGSLVNVPLLNNLAILLQINELRNIKFTECQIDFTVANQQLTTPTIRMLSPQLHITGKGVISLNNRSLNHELTLAVAPELLAKVSSEISDIFQKQPNGFLGITFHITGTYHAPHNDIAEILLGGAAQSVLRKGLQKLFK